MPRGVRQRSLRQTIVWLFRFLWPHRLRWAGLVALSFVMIGTGLVDPLIFKFIIDDVLTAGKIALLAPAVLVFLAAKLASLWLAYLYGVAYERFVQRILLSIRHELFERIEYKQYAFFKKRELGDLIRLLTSDVWSVRQLLASGERLFINAVRLTAILVIVAFLDWRVLFLVLLALPIYALVQRRYLHAVGHQAKGVAASDVRVLNFFTARLSNILLVKLFSQEDRESRLEKHLTTKYSELNVRYLAGVLRSMTLIGSVTVLAVAALFWFGGSAVLSGALTVGSLVALYGYTLQLFEPVSGLVSTPFTLQETRASLSRISDLLSAKEEPAGARAAAKAMRGDIRFDHVRFRYPERPDRVVLEDVTLRIRSGERVAIVGKSGSGKSTLALLLLRLYEPAGGSILLDGRPLETYPPRVLRSRIGFVPQMHLLFPGSVEENLLYANPRASREELEQAARAAAIHERIVALPDGYRTSIGSGGGRFSEGEKQRLSIARALLRHPDIFLFDEPTSALDAHTAAQLNETLERVTRGRTTILITHQLAAFDFVDRVFLLHSGRLREIEGGRSLRV
ncbi:ABC transporter ATP-binding protein [Candidatus Uhrbacteria bacterium]|nr:MAG: ABC transporter ATP-binding protein [Candidatus Uhrbacteria bacterium]